MPKASTGIVAYGGRDERRSMIFVDGENLTMRAQKVANAKGKPLVEGDSYMPDVFFWFPMDPLNMFTVLDQRVSLAPLRAYFYTSCPGAEDRCRDIEKKLWNIGFSAHVFHKPRSQKSKGVDITLTKDMLSHAFLGNYEVAVLVSGDADYVPLVREVQRLGKIVWVAGFEGPDGGLSDELERASDFLIPLNSFLP